MLSWSILVWSIILCTVSAGQLLPGTPKVVVFFQGCCDGQNLASPGHAAWDGCHVHPLLFLFHRNNVSCSFNFRLSWNWQPFLQTDWSWVVKGWLVSCDSGTLKKGLFAWFSWRASWRLLKISEFWKVMVFQGGNSCGSSFAGKRLVVFRVWLCNGHWFSWRKYRSRPLFTLSQKKSP